MSRWAEMFAALSHARDTVDPLRHNDEPASTLSHTVESVTAPEPMRASPSLQRRAGERWSKSAAGWLVNIAHESEVPRVWAEGLAQLDRDRHVETFTRCDVLRQQLHRIDRAQPGNRNAVRSHHRNVERDVEHQHESFASESRST